MKCKVIYGRYDAKGRISVARVEERDLIDHYAAIELSMLEGVAAVAANETMKRQMVYVGGKLTQV